MKIKLSRYITSNLEDILPNLIQTIKKQKPEISDTEAEEIVKHLWSIIPQGNKHILTPWLVKVYLKNNGYIDEERARLLINTLYQAKTMFPNNFPKDFNINNYSDLDELEAFLDPWIIKLSTIQEKHTEIEQSQELGKIVFQKGDYKVLRIDKPEDIVEFLRINNIDSWCIKNLDYARRYGPTWFLIKNNSVIGAYAMNEGILRDRNNQPMKDLETKRIFIEFLKQDEQEDKADKLLVYIPMTKEEIDDFIDKGKYLNKLYENQVLTPGQIDKAIDKGKDLYALYQHQKLTPSQIDKAIDKGKDLDYLYMYQKLSPKQIDKAIEKGESVLVLYQYQENLTGEQIDKTLNIGKKDISKCITKIMVNDLLSLTKEDLNDLVITPLLDYWENEYKYYSIIDLPSVPELYNICNDIEEYITDEQSLIYEYTESRNLSDEGIDDIISDMITEIQEEITSIFLGVVEEELEKKTQDISKDYQKLYKEILKKEGYNSIEEAPEDLLFDIDEQLAYSTDFGILDFTDEEVIRIRKKFKKLVREKYGYV